MDIQKVFVKAVRRYIPDQQVHALGENYIEQTLIWAAEKMGRPYARVAHK
jgi:hypothetical protein